MITLPFLLLACVGIVQAAVDAPKSLNTDLQETCEAFRVENRIVGMAVTVIRKREVLFDAQFGLADREAQRAVDSASLFRLASISKPVTATMVMQLVDAGKLALDADVRALLAKEPSEIPRIELRQVLAHTSGIRHYLAGREDNGTSSRTTKQVIDGLAQDALLFAPGTKYSYSTHAFSFAVAAIEKASERSFVEQVRKQIAANGCPTLDCEVASEKKPARTALYGVRGPLVLTLEPREDLSWKYGGGGMESTALDLARFADRVLHAELVSAQSRDAMWTRQQLADGSFTEYGLGWGVGRNGTSASHTGQQQGANCGLLIVRNGELIIAVLANTDGANADNLVGVLRKKIESKR